MKFQLSLLAAATAAPAALAHTVFVGLGIDGVYQGAGLAMRMSRVTAKATFPLADLTSNDLACNVNGSLGVSRVLSVQDGATLSFPFLGSPNDPSKESLDPGHKGPCAVYLKKVDDAMTDPGYGDGWFKIWADGYDAASGQWATDKAISAGGRLNVQLPPGLQGGYYLARPEILALHNASQGDAQFYTGCAQIFIDSQGDLVPKDTVSIPGYVQSNTPSTFWNIYTQDNSQYPVPGPAVASLVTGAVATAGQATQADGFQPAGCIAVNDNWCGFEVPSYSDEAGCWSSQQNCWTQGSTCYNSSLVTGNSGCGTWDNYCQTLENACKAGNFDGPTNANKSMVPALSTWSVGALIPTSGVSLGAAATQAPASSTSAASAQTTSSASQVSAAAQSTGPSTYGAAVSTQMTTLATQTSANPTHVVYNTVKVTTTEVVTAKARRSGHARRHGGWGLLEGVF